MTVRDILKNHLEVLGYAGLYRTDCACEVDDLFPCGEDFSDCEPGYKIPCNPETCGADGDCSFHIGPKETP